MLITQCLHTAILVTDLDRAKHFYGNVLELQKIDRSLKYAGAWYQVGEFQLHLIVHLNLVAELPNSEKWGRNPHVAFAVKDLEEVKKHLQTHGFPIQMSASGRAALFTRDPDGNVIEMSQV